MNTATLFSVAVLLGGAFPTIEGVRTEVHLSEAAVVHDNQRSNASLTMAIKAGALFAERYQLVSKLKSQDWPSSFPGYKKGLMLGRGAFGETWLATDQSNGASVAVKFFYRDTAMGTVLLNMANADEDELRDLNAMKNECDIPGLIMALNSGAYANRFAKCFVNNVNTRSGPSYMVLEIAGSMNLQDYLEKNTPSADEVLLIAMMLFEGLVQMQGKYVHRDIKPANLMVTVGSDGKIADLKYIDFGLTVKEGAAGYASGTPFFMPPELWPVSPGSTRARSSHDVYSVGETLYEICCGNTFHSKIWDEFYDNSKEEKKQMLETVKPGSKCKSTRSPAYMQSEPLIELFDAIRGQMLAVSGRSSGSELLSAMQGYWTDMPSKVPEVEEALMIMAPSEKPFLTRCHQEKAFWFANMVQCCGEEKPDPLRDAICAKPCGGKVAFIPGTRCVDNNNKEECKEPATMKFSDAHFCCVPIAYDYASQCQYVGPWGLNHRRMPLPSGAGWLWQQM